MKPRQILAAGGYLLATFSSGTVHAQNTAFYLANDTQFTVYAVYIWPAGIQYRGPDLLGDDTIGSGRTYSFMPTDGNCHYNMRIKLNNGEEKRWNDLNLCGLTTITVHYNYVDHDLVATRD